MEKRHRLTGCSRAIAVLGSLTLVAAAACSGGGDAATPASSSSAGGAGTGSSSSSSSSASSSSGSSGGGGAGGAMQCAPGATKLCYSGPAATEGVGVCKGGAQTCGSDGTWGVCAGEIVPTPELCDTPADEDCTGSPSCASFEIAWGSADGADLDVDAGGNAVVVGSFHAPVDFGGGVVTPTSTESFVAKYDPKGKLLWEKTFASYVDHVAMAPNGDPIVSGATSGVADLGGGSFCMPNGSCPFLLELDAASGAYVRSLTWPNSFAVTALAVDHGGNVLAGLGSTLSKYDPMLKLLATTGVAGAGAVRDIAVDANDDVFFAGEFAFSVKIAGVQLSSAGANDAYAASVDSTLATVRWVKQFGGAGGEGVQAIAVDSKGDVRIAGTFDASLDLGTGKMTTAGKTDGFVAKLDGATGAPSKALRYGGIDADTARELAIDAQDDVVVAGRIRGTGDFDGKQVTTAMGNVLVAKLGPNLAPIWVRGFGDANGFDEAVATKTDASSNVWVTTSEGGLIDFGLGAKAGGCLVTFPP